MRRVRVATVITRMEAGAGVVALRGARSLDPDRYQVSIIAGSGDRLLDEAADAGLEVTVEPTLRAPIAPRDDVRALRRLSDVLARQQFDVVHTHSAKAGAVGRLAAHWAGVPRIVHTFHGFPFHEFQSAARQAAYVGIERRLGRFTDVALCVGTNVSVEAIRRRLIAPERVRTIGVTVDNFAATSTPEARAQAREALALPLTAQVVGAVGRLAYQKAPEDFVAAMVALDRPDVIGVWIGGGELAERVELLAKRALPRADVRFVGERTNVPEMLPAFDVFALPSRYEGLPVAIVEAMVCGIPVVATAVNAVSDVVVPGETGFLVRPEQPNQLAAAVARLLDSPADAARMALAAKARLGDHHAAQTLADVLDSAYAGRPTPGYSKPAQPLMSEEPTCA